MNALLGIGLGTALGLGWSCAVASNADPRLREVLYDPNGVVTVPVKRGVVTLVVFGADESIVEVASGHGADCAKANASWCVATQPGARTLFVKPRSGAGPDNNLTVVTDRRIHNLRLVVLAEGDAGPPTYRLIMALLNFKWVAGHAG